MKNVAYIQNRDIITREEGEEAMIFNPENSDIMVLNLTGRFIWLLCQDRITKEEIITRVISEFKVTSERAKKDLDKFLEDLQKRNFIKRT